MLSDTSMCLDFLISVFCTLWLCKVFFFFSHSGCRIHSLHHLVHLKDRKVVTEKQKLIFIFLTSLHIHWFPFHWGSNYSNGLWPSAVWQPGQSTLRGLWGTHIVVCHYWRFPSRPPACPVPSPAWWVFTHSKSHLNALGHASHSLEPIRSRPLFCHHDRSSDLGRPAVDRRREVMRRGSNVLLSLQATMMRFKWSSTQRFLISLIKFTGNPLPTASIYMEK